MKKFETIRVDGNIPLPFKKRQTDAGYDLYAAENTWLLPFQTKVIQSNHRILIEDGYFGFVQARSSIRSRGMLIEGVIDEGYQGVIGIMVTNATPFFKRIKKGERVCQLILLPYINVELREVKEFSKKTDRGNGGFGSTGNK